MYRNIQALDTIEATYSGRYKPSISRDDFTVSTCKDVKRDYPDTRELVKYEIHIGVSSYIDKNNPYGVEKAHQEAINHIARYLYGEVTQEIQRALFELFKLGLSEEDTKAITFLKDLIKRIN